MTGRGWSEIQQTFQFVDIETLNDPVYAYAALLILSVVVSLISATYYFKIYELMSPKAADSEIHGAHDGAVVHMVHDSGSIATTLILCVLVTTWIGSVT